jgi:hypothetical protein
LATGSRITFVLFHKSNYTFKGGSRVLRPKRWMIHWQDPYATPLPHLVCRRDAELIVRHDPTEEATRRFAARENERWPYELDLAANERSVSPRLKTDRLKVGATRSCELLHVHDGDRPKC